MSKLTYGVGINDADYPVTVNEKIDGKYRRTWTCPYYKVWVNMLKRCYCEKYQRTMPTYETASVDPRWFRFSTFRKWMCTQVWHDLELDKDILSSGGKVYSEDTCCFVPRRVNSVLHINTKSRGEFPIGAAFVGSTGKFQALCRDIDTKTKSLGTFVTASEAHRAWQIFKASVVLSVAETYSTQTYGREDVFNRLLKVADKLITESKEGKETVDMWNNT